MVTIIAINSEISDIMLLRDGLNSFMFMRELTKNCVCKSRKSQIRHERPLYLKKKIVQLCLFTQTALERISGSRIWPSSMVTAWLVSTTCLLHHGIVSLVVLTVCGHMDFRPWGFVVILRMQVLEVPGVCIRLLLLSHPSAISGSTWRTPEPLCYTQPSFRLL